MIAQGVTGSVQDSIAHARTANLQILESFIADPWPLDQLGMTAFVGGVDPDPWSPLQLVAEPEPLFERWRTLESCNCALGDGLTEELCVEYYDGFPFDPYDTCWEWFCGTYYGNTRSTVDRWAPSWARRRPGTSTSLPGPARGR
ncbi:MAG: hypothetical protein ACI8PZ_006053 [Myxococcota bacterium]|jgi:hypothetical protein